MTKKELLDIPQIIPDFGFGSGGSIVPQDSGGSGNPNERNITATSNQQMAIIDAYAKKAIHAVAKMKEINKHATEQFHETIENISDLQIKP